MPNERRVSLIKKIVWMVFTLGVAGSIYFYHKSTRNEADLVATASAAKHVETLELILHHLPGQPESDRTAAALRKIQNRYSKQVILTTHDFNKVPKNTKIPGTGKLPYVVMMMGKRQVYEFSGYKPAAEIQRKVDEVLHGLERMDRNWRPPVPGMTPAGQ